MSNPDELIDTICVTAKMDATASSADRALALLWLQRAADETCAAAGVRIPAEDDVALTSGVAVYTLNASPFATDMIALHEVRVTNASVTGEPIRRVSLSHINELRAGSQSTATPYVYAVDWPQFILYPTPGSGTTLYVYYSQDAPTLADNSTAISFIPKAFHWGCLYNRAMAEALRYKKQPEWRDYMDEYLNNRQSGIPALKRWHAESGGRLASGGVSGRLKTSPSQDTGF